MKAHNTAVGPDDMHYEFIKQLPSKSLQLLLKMCNNIWTNVQLHRNVEKPFIVAIPKIGKDDTNSENSRPLALSNCLYNLQRKVNKWLIWYLETKGLISD